MSVIFKNIYGTYFAGTWRADDFVYLLISIDMSLRLENNWRFRFQLGKERT